MKKFLQPNRLMYFLGTIVMGWAALVNIQSVFTYQTVIPYIQLIKVFINCICTILCCILVFYPQKKILTYIVFFTQAGNSALVGFIGIGTMLFSSGVILYFINGEFIINRRKKVCMLTIYWLLIVLTTYPVLGLNFFIFEIIFTLFSLAIYATVYKKLESKLSYLLPPTEIVTTEIDLPPKGALLELSCYGLSQRQQAFIIGSIKEGETYEVLADRHNVSVSVVKKDMAAACKLFGVTNREALRILLLQYKW